MFGKKTSTQSRSTSWRNQFLRQSRDVVKHVAINMPETIELPITFKKSMFEFGGSAKNFGTAMIISDAKGYPSSGKLVKNIFSNGLQAEVSVWPGCLVGIADHNKGSEVFTIYKITEIKEKTEEDLFGTAVAKRIAYKKGNSFTGSTKESWYDNLKSDYWCIEEFSKVLYEKLYTINCIEPMYIEWFGEIKHQLMLRRQFFNVNRNWFSSGICDSDSIAHSTSPTFTDFYNSLCTRANELSNKEKNRIVVAMIGHYFAMTNDDGNVEQITDYENLDVSKCFLITEGRIVTMEEYTKNPTLHIDEHVYTYAHTPDDNVSPFNIKYNEEGEEVARYVNVGYFLSDPSFVEFTHKHPGDYVSLILNKKFYQDIMNNLNPRPYAASDRAGNPILNEDGSRKIITPEKKVHPETQTSMLLFVGSARAFFDDIKSNFAKRSEEAPTA